jgi:hypothetical protein
MLVLLIMWSIVQRQQQLVPCRALILIPQAVASDLSKASCMLLAQPPLGFIVLHAEMPKRHVV